MSTSFSENLKQLINGEQGFEKIEQYLVQASQLCFVNTSASCVFLRKFVEAYASVLSQKKFSNLSEKINFLLNENTIDAEIHDALNNIRILGNRGAHSKEDKISNDDNMMAIEHAWKILVKHFETKRKNISRYVPPKMSESDRVFREAFLGINQWGEKSGDPLAMYHAAMALQRAYLNDKENRFKKMYHTDIITQFFHRSMSSVPESRTELAKIKMINVIDSSEHFSLLDMKIKEKTEEEKNEIMHLLEWAIEDNEPEACYIVGTALMTGKMSNFSIDIDIEKGVDLLNKSVSYEFQEAFLPLGFYYFEKNDHEKSKELFKRGYELGNLSCQSLYGDILAQNILYKDEGFNLILDAYKKGEDICSVIILNKTNYRDRARKDLQNEEIEKLFNLLKNLALNQKEQQALESYIEIESKKNNEDVNFIQLLCGMNFLFRITKSQRIKTRISMTLKRFNDFANNEVLKEKNTKIGEVLLYMKMFDNDGMLKYESPNDYYRELSDSIFEKAKELTPKTRTYPAIVE